MSTMRAVAKVVAALFGSTIVAVVATGILVAATTSSPAHAETEFKWQHFGAGSYASSRDEAMRMRKSAFQKFGFPISAITQLLRTTEKPGEDVHIVFGEHFEAMILEGNVVRRDIFMALDKPIAAERWQLPWEGKIITIFLLEGYFSWCVKFASTSGAGIMACPVPKGHIRLIAAHAAQRKKEAWS